MSPLLKKSKKINLPELTKYCLISGGLALFVMLFVFIVQDNTLVGGKNTVLRMDLYHQYGPLYSELYDRIVNGYSLTYSWTSGAGGGFLGNLFNYCCSPFAIIMLVCGHENMPEAIALMMVAKAVFAAMSFTYYINKSNKNNNLLSCAFGLMYAFSGFFVAYSWNIMWLDAMAVFPLVILGLEWIVDKRKPTMFICTLTYTMITNYYMAYMVCLLSVLYFLYYYFSNYTFTDKLNRSCGKMQVPATAAMEENVWEAPAQNPAEISEGEVTVTDTATNNTVGINKKTKTKTVKAKKTKKHRLKNSRFWASGWTFVGAAVLSAMLASFALLPLVNCLGASSATSSKAPEDLKLYFNFFDFIANHLMALEPTIRSSGENVLPNVYCGMLTLFLLPLYYLSGKVSAKKKIVTTVFLGVFFLGFSVNMFNFIWHGLHFPNDLPYRYSFGYSFLLLTMAYEVLMNIKDYSKKELTVAGIALVIFIFIIQKVGSKNVENTTVMLAALFTILYVIVLGALNSPRFSKEAMAKYLVFIILLEICVGNTGKYVMAQPKSNYTSDYQTYQQIAESVQSKDDEKFYRTELSRLRTRMDACWYGYQGVSTFSSMAYENTSGLMKSLGLFSNKINSYTYYPQTPIFNSIFSLKYIYDNDNLLKNGDYYNSLEKNDVFEAYEYEYWLPLAFSVDGEMKSFTATDTNPFNVQNSLMADATGVENIMEAVDATKVETTNLKDVSVDAVNTNVTFTVNKNTKGSTATATVIIDVEEPGYYYVYAGSTKLSNLKITAADFDYSYASSSIQPLTMDVGYQEAGDTIRVEYTVDADNDSSTNTFCAARLNLDKFKEAYEKIQKNGTIKITENDETYLSGTINVSNDNAFMFTSIPYDNSWEITVDGEVLDYYDADNDENNNGKIIAVGNGLIGFDIAKGEHTVEFRYKAIGLSAGIKISVFAVIICALLLFWKYYLSDKILIKGKKFSVFCMPDTALENSENEPVDGEFFVPDENQTQTAPGFETINDVQNESRTDGDATESNGNKE